MIDSLTGNDYTLCLCSGLKAIGSDVTLIVPEFREINTPVDFEVKFYAPTKKSGYNKLQKAVGYLKYLIKLYRYIRNYKIDIVHFQFFRRERIESLYFLFLRLMGINLVHTAHNVFPQNKHKIDYILKLIVYKSAKVIIVHSNHIKKIVTNTFRIERKKVAVIPHGNFDKYLPEKTINRADIRKNFKLSDHDFVILFFGMIRKNKGLDLLLDAFEIVAHSDDRFKLIIAGRCQNDQLYKNYKEKISKSAVKEKIFFFSEFVPDNEVAHYFVAADIVVLPYKEIYHSGILHLVFSFGKTAIVTRVGDFNEFIKNGITGYILKENTRSCLADAIRNAFSKPKELETIGKNVANMSKTTFAWENIGRLTIELYQNLP